jgi:threonine/homoserine/homoserine lactone efflux protein
MKDILDIVVWIGFIYLLFVFLRGLNETQIKKHDQKLKEKEKYD